MINGNIVLLAEYLEKNLGVTASEGAMFAEEILKQFGQSDSLLDRLQAVERDNGLLKEQIRVADVAYQSLHERHQAVEKSHTALRLASEELIACVRHGDQEDIGEAMAKVEAILQPKEQ